MGCDTLKIKQIKSLCAKSILDVHQFRMSLFCMLSTLALLIQNAQNVAIQCNFFAFDLQKSQLCWSCSVSSLVNDCSYCKMLNINTATVSLSAA